MNLNIMNKTKGEKELIEKLLKHTLELYAIQKRDRILYGNSFVEFGERSMKVLDPKDKIVKNLDKEVIQISKTTKGKPYGKSIIKRGKLK